MSELHVPTGPFVPATVAADGAALPPDIPEFVGRYRVQRLLGRGGFGHVYLAVDERLCRPVAVKVLLRSARPGDADAYLAEARVLAGLDHPHIVPVYDADVTPDESPYVVSKYIEGSDLRQRLDLGRPAFAESAGLVAAVADALHHAHRAGLVHRDVKPANILLDATGKAYLADFGLALQDEDFGRGPGSAGTPDYMSPEQASGEGHRTDGRSDVFSLGVVLYELLVGRRPFRGTTAAEVMDQIRSVESRPPRQLDDTIPTELERICLKSLAKRPAERYTTAKDMADDLRQFLRAWTPDDALPLAVEPANPLRSRRLVWVGVVAVALAVVAGGVAYLVANGPSGDRKAADDAKGSPVKPVNDPKGVPGQPPSPDGRAVTRGDLVAAKWRDAANDATFEFRENGTCQVAFGNPIAVTRHPLLGTAATAGVMKNINLGDPTKLLEPGQFPFFPGGGGASAVAGTYTYEGNVLTMNIDAAPEALAGELHWQEKPALIRFEDRSQTKGIQAQYVWTRVK